MAGMLIAEELFLLLRRDDGKPESAMAHRGYGFAAALLTDLVVARRITLSDDKDPRMSARSDTRRSTPRCPASRRETARSCRPW